MKKLRIGVIGLGAGWHHLNNYNKHPQAVLTAVADLNPARLKKVADEFKVPGRYSSGEEMLKREKLDVVSVALPNKFHKPLTLAALKAGCHVLCEKPMALNAGEAREMIAAAKKARKRLMINFSFRFYDQTWALKQQVDSGMLGEIYYGRTFWHRRRGIPGFGGWFTSKEAAGGGPLIDLGVHRLDLALWLMGNPKPAWVMAVTHNTIAAALAKKAGKKFDVEDFAGGLIRFTNGAALSLEASWAGNIERQEWMETRLWGTKAGLVQRNTTDGSGFYGYTFEALLSLEKDGAQYDMKLQPPVPGAKPSMCYFLDCILANKPHIATGEEGLRVMEILDGMYKSARTGKPVQLK